MRKNGLMARVDNNYGAGGSNSDEFGELPPKRIENMHSCDCCARSPISHSDLRLMIKDHYKKTGKVPTKLLYPGSKVNTTTIGIISDLLGYVTINLVNEPFANGLVLE